MITNQQRKINYMQEPKRIFITGTNRGLGSSLVKLLHKQNPDTEIHISSRGHPQELSEKWSAEIPGHNFKTYQIDLNSPQSIAQTVKSLKEKSIQFDYIVANAAVGADYGTELPSVKVARDTLITNVISTIDFIKQFLPLLSANGRVVIVSSSMGALNVQSKELQARVTNPSITQKDILTIVDEYIKGAEKKDLGYYHWSAYRTSKVLINAWGRFVLPTYLKKGQTSINLCPGWCKTDMGGQNAFLTPQQGAQRISQGIWLKETDPTRFFGEHKYVDYFTCA